ncbi:MAG: hypothetical protein ABI426_07780 [Flavobacterium sp.]
MNKGCMKTIGIGLVILVILFILADLGDTKYRENRDEDIAKEHPKTKNIEELKAWAKTYIVDDYCKQYAEVKSIQNETKKQRELSDVENSRMQFVIIKIRNVIEDNDLPDSYGKELYNYVNDEITKCE